MKPKGTITNVQSRLATLNTKTQDDDKQSKTKHNIVNEVDEQHRSCKLSRMNPNTLDRYILIYALQYPMYFLL